MTLVVKVEEVARRLGLPQPLDENDRWLVEQSLLDAQTDLEAYLGRSVTVASHTESGLLYRYNGFQLKHWPLVAITDVLAETDTSGRSTGFYTVEYTAGLDGLNDPALEPIRRFVRVHAIYSPMLQAMFRRLRPEDARRTQSLSVEGQSVTYVDTYATDAQASAMGLPGGLPSLKSCEQWRIAGRMVHQAPTNVLAPWPFDDPYTHDPNSGQWWA